MSGAMQSSYPACRDGRQPRSVIGCLWSSPTNSIRALKRWMPPQVERMDHGIRSLEDEQLLDYLRKTQLPLTLCPFSNVQVRRT